MPRKRTPVKRSKHPKSFQEVVLEHLGKERKLVLSIKKDMRKIIEEGVEKKYGETIHTMEAFRDFAVIAIMLMKEKGLLDRKEIDRILDALKEKGIGELLR